MSSKTCNGCVAVETKTPTAVPYVVYESSMARAERTQKSFIQVIVLLIVLLVGTNIGWLIYESQFEGAEENVTIFEDVTQESGDGNNNLVGGDTVGTTDD